MNNTKPGILVVEDENVVAMDLENDLARLGYDVVGIADNGPEAVRIARDTHPQLVLMDIKLRGQMDGVETARKIRDSLQAPIVFITANTNEGTFTRAQEIQPFAYLTKPYRASDLNAAVALALQQHKVVRALFEENTWLTTMLSTLSEGVIATDVNGLVRYANPLAEKLTGWTGAAALAQPIESIYRLATVDGQPVDDYQLRRVLRNERNIGRAEFLLHGRTGKQLFVEETAAPITDANGDLIGAVTLFLDITERRRAEQQREDLRMELERSNEDLSRFSYGLVHDLQAPANSVRTLGEMLRRQREGELNEGQLRLLDMMTSAAEGMQRLVNSMLSFAQIGNDEIKRDSTAVKELSKL